MNKYTDHENTAINGIQYSKSLKINEVAFYPFNNQNIDYGITLEIHNDGTSQFAHKETEQYTNPSGEQVYVVQTDTKEDIL